MATEVTGSQGPRLSDGQMPDGFEFYRDFCFPVSNSSVADALHKLSASPGRAVDGAEGYLRSSDPQVAEVLDAFKRAFKERAEFYRVGFLFVYKALQNEADSRNKRMPPHAHNFARQFMTAYNAGRPYIRPRDPVELKKGDPALYSGLMQIGPHFPSRSVVVAGAVDLYTMFRNPQLLLR